jgi:hypothetical protein
MLDGWRLPAAGLSHLRGVGCGVVSGGACGHDGLIHPAALVLLGPDDRVVDLAPRLRCRECDARGRAVVSIKWGGAT